MLWFGRRRRVRRGFRMPRGFPGTPPTVPWAGRPIFHDPPLPEDNAPPPDPKQP